MNTEILEILTELRPEFNYEDSDNFIEDGLLDSFDIIALCSKLEEKYQIKIDWVDILPESFSSLSSIESLVRKYLK